MFTEVYVKEYDYNPYDIAVAFRMVAELRYGSSCFVGVRRRGLSRLPIIRRSVKIGCDEETIGLTGPVMIRGLPATFLVCDERASNISARVKRKHQRDVEQFLDDVGTHLKKRSIYRGKALVLGGDIGFLDLSAVSFDDVVYHPNVWAELNAHIWTMFEKPDACARARIPMRRKILLQGPYGSGKTLAAFLTAKKAVDHGYTFVYLEPTAAQDAQGIIRFALFFTRQYQPAVLCIEDIDREERHDNAFFFGSLLNQIDGMLSKNTQMMVVMTTNRLDRISGGMQRPGRIDKIIDCSRFEAPDMKRLLQISIPAAFLDPTINWENVLGHCSDYQPAFVREVAQSALLTAISESNDDTTILVRETALIRAADNLRLQHENCKITGTPGFKR